MARIVVAPAVWEDLDRLTQVLGLPADTRDRVRNRLRTLGIAPRQGAVLTGRWTGFRFVLGPWPWMLIIYVLDDGAEQVNVVTIQDARSARSATSAR